MGRTAEQIKNDYQVYCMYLGEKINQISLLNKDVRLLQSKIKKLNKEMEELIETQKTAEVKSEQPAGTQ